MFGDNLKNLMYINGTTQQNLADKIGYAQRTISSWINNQSEPTEKAITKCATYFNVSADYLLGLEDDFGAKIAVSTGNPMNAQERELLETFRELSPYLQGLTLDTVRSFAGKNKDSLHKKA